MTSVMQDLYETWRQRNHLCVVTVATSGFSVTMFRKTRRELHISTTHRYKCKTERSIEDTITLIQKCLAERDSLSVPLILSLPQQKCKHHWLQLSEDTTEPFEIVTSQARQLLPPGMNPDDAVPGYRMVRNLHRPDWAMITIARRDEIELWAKQLKQTGAPVAAMLSDPTLVLSALPSAFPESQQQNLALLYCDVHLNLFSIQAGEVEKYTPIPVLQDPNGWQDHLKHEIIASTKNAGLARIVAAGNPATASRTKEVLLLLRNEFGKNAAETSELDLLASGIAIEHFYPAADWQDLRPAELADEYETCRQKAQIVTICLSLFTTLLFLFLMALGAHWFAKREHSSWLVRVEAVQTQLQQIEQLKDRRASLQAELEFRESVLNRKSRFANTLLEISRRIPEKVWLRRLRFEYASERATREHNEIRRLELQGVATDETRPAALLGNLEQLNSNWRIQLQYLRRLSKDQVWKKTKKFRQPLIEFRVHAENAQARP